MGGEVGGLGGGGGLHEHGLPLLPSGTRSAGDLQAGRLFGLT